MVWVDARAAWAQGQAQASLAKDGHDLCLFWLLYAMCVGCPRESCMYVALARGIWDRLGSDGERDAFGGRQWRRKPATPWKRVDLPKTCLISRFFGVIPHLSNKYAFDTT